MATKLLQIELLENHLFLEVEAEETMTFRTIISKLKTQEHLNPEISHFIKTQSGGTIREISTISSCKQNSFVITEDPDWKCPAMKNGQLTEVPEIAAELIFCDNKYWILPFFTGSAWNEDGLQSQLLSLNDITSPNGKKMSLNIVVQYSLTDATLLGNKKVHDRTVKMRQILKEALNIEIMVNSITENNVYENIEKLEKKLLFYLTSHLESQWGTLIHNLSIVGFREYGK